MANNGNTLVSGTSFSTQRRTLGAVPHASRLPETPQQGDGKKENGCYSEHHCHTGAMSAYLPKEEKTNKRCSPPHLSPPQIHLRSGTQTGSGLGVGPIQWVRRIGKNTWKGRYSSVCARDAQGRADRCK